MQIVGVLLSLMVLLQAGIHPLSADEARVYIREGKFDWIVDVRTDQEWNAGHYPTAVHIPLHNLQQLLPKIIVDTSQNILFYCKSGKRAANASIIAYNMGYVNSYYLKNATYTDLMEK
jgi:rhodanese-related sulfurtransferase